MLDLLGRRRPPGSLEEEDEEDEEEDEAWADARRTKKDTLEAGTPSGPLDILY